MIYLILIRLNKVCDERVLQNPWGKLYFTSEDDARYEFKKFYRVRFSVFAWRIPKSAEPDCYSIINMCLAFCGDSKPDFPYEELTETFISELWKVLARRVEHDNQSANQILQ